MINTHEVFVRIVDAAAAIMIVRWLRDKGLVQGTDFDFRYDPRGWDQESFEFYGSGVSFFFTEEKWATFMRLKYGDNVQQGP